MENLINWISSNKNWIFEGVGVAAITGIIAFFWNKKKSNQDGTYSNTITGDGNYQAGRDINITNTSEKKSPIRPRIEIELLIDGSGQQNRWISSKNSTETATFTTEAIYHFELYWEYKLIIRNNSNVPAYGLSLNIKNGKFNYVDKINSLEPLLPNTKIELNARIERNFEGKGYESQNILSQPYPDEIKDLLMIAEYMNEDRNVFSTEFKIENGSQLNKTI